MGDKREAYTPGYTENAVQFMAKRTAATHAGFFLPLLRWGMTVLDCGCGPGTISAGLAAAVTPGTAVGVDTALSQVMIAQAQAQEQGLDNLHFEVASVYTLPFTEQAFDAVFAHALIEHLAEPLQALSEMHRVLRPGGVIGVCSPDWGGFLLAPPDPAVDEAITFYKNLQHHNGGNPYIGRELGSLLAAAGFSAIELSARYECYERRERIAEYLAASINMAHEFADEAARSRMSTALRQWAKQPGSLFAQAWVAATGRA